MPSIRLVRILLVVGLLLLPGPAYAVALEQVDPPEPHRSPTGYVAEPINVSNDSVVAEEYGQHVTFRVESMKYEHIAREYRAPNETRDFLDRAIENGTATTNDSAVAADVQEINDTYPFVTRNYEDTYDLVLTKTDGALRVNATPANDSEIAAVVRDRYVVHYESLSEGKQRTFDKILNVTRSEDSYGYRPWSDEPMIDRPAIVEKNGSHYAIRTAIHVDDFDFPDGLFVGLVASGVGIACILSGTVFWLYERPRGGD